MPQLNAELSESLNGLVPINGLAPQYQKDIISQTRVVDYGKGQVVFKRGDKDNYSFYLLQGQLDLSAGERLVKQVVGGSEEARHALAQLQPRQLTATARSDVRMALVDRQLLDRLLVLGNEEASASEMEVNEIESTESGDWMTRVLQSDLFNRIPAVNIQQIFARMEPVSLAEGDAVIRQGDPGDFYYIMQTGRCEVTRATSNSTQVVKLAELSAGDSFGEEALLSDAPRNATITMLTPGNLMRLDKAAFDELIKQPALNAVDYAQAQELVAAGAQWLDVRFPDEHKSQALPESRNMPLYVLRMEAAKLPRDKTYVVYCDTGSRSSVGAFLLMQRGFDACYLSGGLVNSPVASETAAPAADAAPAAPAAAVESSPESVPVPPMPPEEGPGPRKIRTAADALEFINALKAELAKTRAQLKQALMQKSRAETAYQTLEKRLRAEFEARLDNERQQYAEELEKAGRWKEAAEKARREAVAKAEQMIAEFQESQEEEEQRLAAERAGLEEERRKLAQQRANLEQSG